MTLLLFMAIFTYYLAKLSFIQKASLIRLFTALQIANLKNAYIFPTNSLLNCCENFSRQFETFILKLFTKLPFSNK